MNTRRPKSLYRLRMTRLGLHFLFVALFAMVGGSLRGFNLLLALAGLLVSVLIVQWRQGRGIIRKTLLQREEPVGGFVDQAIRIRYLVTNSRIWLPIWMLRIEDQVVLKLEGYTKRDRDSAATLVTSVGSVRAGRHARTSIVCRFSRRGRYQLGPLVVSTSFPFSLMDCERLFRSTRGELFVYPAMLDLRRGWQALLPIRRDGDGQRMTGGSNDQGEFFGLRHWQSGDRVKQIHWRTTARIGEPAVRKFEKRSRHQVCLVIDGVSNPDQISMESFEQVLRMAATLIVKLSQQTQSVGLVCIDSLAVADPEHATLIHGEGRETTRLLQRLALAEACTPDAKGRETTVQSSDPLSSVVTGMTRELSAYDLVVISSRKLTDAYSGNSPMESSGCEPVDEFWRQMKQHGRLSWIDVNSHTTKRYLLVDGLGEETIANPVENPVGSQYPTNQKQIESRTNAGTLQGRGV